MTGEGAIVVLVIAAAGGWLARHLWKSFGARPCGKSCCCPNVAQTSVCAAPDAQRAPSAGDKMEV